MFLQKSLKNSLFLFFSSLFIELSRLFKVSFMWGSYTAFFSVANIFTPMIGVFGGLSRFSILFFVQAISKFFIFGTSFIPLLGLNIPHFFATAYWNSKSKLFKIAIPGLSILLFIAHPVGQQAYLYSFLWFIPITIALIGTKNIFCLALGSTFTAHSIGSVIWIYSISMSAQEWVALIPVAIIERVLFASGMVIIYYSYFFVKNRFSNRLAQFKTKILLKSI